MEIGSYADWVTAVANLGVAAAAICAARLGFRGLNAWRMETIGKRKAELAEQVLADFYEARDVFQFARQPFTFNNEGSTRQKEAGETEADTQRLNTYFTVSERLLKKNDVFANLSARQYRFLALFGHGPDQVKVYDEVLKIRTEVMSAVSMLMITYRDSRSGSPQPEREVREKWESAIGWSDPRNDAIVQRINKIVQDVEKICRPAIEEVEAKRKAIKG
jgi:hypothetical protein